MKILGVFLTDAREFINNNGSIESTGGDLSSGLIEDLIVDIAVVKGMTFNAFQSVQTPKRELLIKEA